MKIAKIIKITIEIDVDSKTGYWSLTTLQNGKETDVSFHAGGNQLYDLEDEVIQSLDHELINHGLMSKNGDLREQTFKDGDSVGTFV